MHYKDWPQLLAIIAARKIIGHCVMMLQASVARVVAQLVGYFENPKVYIDK